LNHIRIQILEDINILIKKPNTIIAILALKLYFGHYRLNSQTNRLIERNLLQVQIEADRNCDYASIPPDEKTWNSTWIDHVFNECQKRGIIVERQTIFLQGITENKTIMDYAVQYTDTLVVRGCINQVCRYKKLLLPCELFGTTGRKRTSCYFQNEQVSPIHWKFMEDSFSKPSKRGFKIWKAFLTWLEKRNISTSVDFLSKHPSRWYISTTNKWIKFNDIGSTNYYRLLQNNVYIKIKDPCTTPCDIQILVTSTRRCKILVLEVLNQHGNNCNQILLYQLQINTNIVENIKGHSLLAFIDASLKKLLLGATYTSQTHWESILTNGV